MTDRRTTPPFPRATERSTTRPDRRSVRRGESSGPTGTRRVGNDGSVVGLADSDDGAVPGPRSWTFLTNHAHVLIAISRNPELRQRDISKLVGITEGAVQRIVAELEDDGYLQRERIGRRNRYHVDADRPLRHPLEREHTIDDILQTVNQPA